MNELITRVRVDRLPLAIADGRVRAIASRIDRIRGQAEDVDRPSAWIELGGEFNRLQNNQEIYSPPFLALTPSNLSPPQADEHPPRFGFDANGSTDFNPKARLGTFPLDSVTAGE